ncbi:MAG: hypothetical protein HFI93_11650 [Lachnospiraceae bacterium]|nr:hypothetical protein [Lachnospiraceae bacterium]
MKRKSGFSESQVSSSAVRQSVFRIERRRAFRSKGFWLALLIGCALALSDSWVHFQRVQLGRAYEIQKALDWYDPSTAFSQWIGAGVEWQAVVFYLIFPILAVLPHGTNYYQDRKSGYLKNILQRTDKRTYLRAKYGAVFLSGGTVVLIPLLLNFFLLTLYMPMRTADPLAMLAGPSSPWVQLCYSHTFLYTVIYWVLPFVTGGLFATVSLIMGRLVDFYFTVLIAPFVLAILLYNFAVPLNMNGIAPFYFLQIGMSFGNNPWLIPLLMVLLLIAGLWGFLRKGCRDEIF